MNKWRKRTLTALKVALPLVTLVVITGVAMWLYETRPQAEHQEVGEVAPPVSAVRLERRTVSFPIRSQGTVTPSRQTTLAARVAGQVEWVAESFDASGFFHEGDVLARIDRRDHELRVQRLEASLQSAMAHLKDSQQDLKREQSLTEYDATTEAALQQAEANTEMAAAAVAELKAQVAEARNAVADTQIIAPYDGCIEQTYVELGQFVTIGTKLADCFATDSVEVRLPVDDAEFAFLGLPLGASLKPGSGPEVVLESDFAGRKCQWSGTIIRSEAIVDARSRMVYLVAQVSDPYSSTDRNGGQPLAVGMFVEATIRCPPMADVIVLPESCVTISGNIYVIDPQGRLQRVQLTTLRRERDWIVARGDVPEGVNVCSTRLDTTVPGMAVEVVGEVEHLLAGYETDDGIVDLTESIELATRPERTER